MTEPWSVTLVPNELITPWAWKLVSVQLFFLPGMKAQIGTEAQLISSVQSFSCFPNELISPCVTKLVSDQLFFFVDSCSLISVANELISPFVKKNPTWSLISASFFLESLQWNMADLSPALLLSRMNWSHLVWQNYSVIGLSFFLKKVWPNPSALPDELFTSCGTNLLLDQLFFLHEQSYSVQWSTTDLWSSKFS